MFLNVITIYESGDSARSVVLIIDLSSNKCDSYPKKAINMIAYTIPMTSAFLIR